MKKIRKSNKGFTLVELIIVIAIIAVLTAVAAPQYLKYVDQGRWSVDQDNAQIYLAAVQTAAADEEYTVADGTYVFNASGFAAGTAASGDAAKNLVNYCADMGIDTTLKVTNKGKATDMDTFTITVAGNSITGKWENKN